MASFSAGTTFTDGVANDVTAAKLGALVNNATPTSGLIQDRTAETVTATNDTLLIGDASDSNALKRITVANFAQTLPTAKITTGTVVTGTFGTTTSTAATITTGTIPTLVATTLVTTGTGTAAAPAIVPTGDTDTGLFFPAADTIAFSEGGVESMRIDSIGGVGIGTTSPTADLQNTVASTARGLVIKNTRPCIMLSDSTDPTYNSYLLQTDDECYLVNGGSGDLRIYNNGSQRLTIDSDGDVSIGTATALSKLHVHGNITLSNTTTATSAGTGGLTLPASAAGYLTVSINGTSRKIPYYAT